MFNRRAGDGLILVVRIRNSGPSGYGKETRDLSRDLFYLIFEVLIGLIFGL